ncbi:hypothetical protein BDW22DRAFT_1341658 [Trametopsis cervina]|nr:hypothetical protein BDW22DRAFT_1341658 [Trametopsis cervina]
MAARKVINEGDDEKGEGDVEDVGVDAAGSKEREKKGSPNEIYGDRTIGRAIQITALIGLARAWESGRREGPGHLPKGAGGIRRAGTRSGRASEDCGHSSPWSSQVVRVVITGWNPLSRPTPPPGPPSSKWKKHRKAVTPTDAPESACGPALPAETSHNGQACAATFLFAACRQATGLS